MIVITKFLMLYSILFSTSSFAKDEIVLKKGRTFTIPQKLQKGGGTWGYGPIQGHPGLGKVYLTRENREFLILVEVEGSEKEELQNLSGRKVKILDFIETGMKRPTEQIADPWDIPTMCRMNGNADDFILTVYGEKPVRAWRLDAKKKSLVALKDVSGIKCETEIPD